MSDNTRTASFVVTNQDGSFKRSSMEGVSLSAIRELQERLDCDPYLSKEAVTTVLAWCRTFRQRTRLYLWFRRFSWSGTHRLDIEIKLPPS
jgi:hypothetical protein